MFLGIERLAFLRSVRFSKKLVLTGLVIFLLFEVGLLGYLSSSKSKLNLPEENSVNLRLEPETGKFKIGEEFFVEILLDTGGYQTDATDVRINYDPQMLQVLKIDEGKLYDSYLAKRFDPKEGAIIVYAVAPEGKVYQGAGVFARLLIKGLKTGTTFLNFDFESGETVDSNVVASKIGRDVLEKVGNCQIEIIQSK